MVLSWSDKFTQHKSGFSIVDKLENIREIHLSPKFDFELIVMKNLMIFGTAIFYTFTTT